MSSADAIIEVGRLMLAFRQEKISDETVALYAEKLADVPADVLKAACDRVIETQIFFPAVAEIRKVAARLSGLLPAAAPEAIAVIRRADRREDVFRRDGSFAYTERFWDWPQDVDQATIDLCVDVLTRVGDPVDDRTGKEHFAWDTGFRQTYAEKLETVSREVLTNLSQARLPAPPQGQLGIGTTKRLTQRQT